MKLVENIVTEKWWKCDFNLYLINLTDVIAKKVIWIENKESNDKVWIYI